LKVKYENDVRKWCGGDFCGWDGDITVDKDDFAAQKTKRPPSPGKPYEMQFKCVAQARAEKTLVDLLLRRHQRREHADYVTQKYLSDGGVMAENFPGHYYRPIKVCSNCYKVYNMIDGSRAKALKKIDRKAARGDGEDGETSARGSARGGTARLGGSTARGHSHARPQNASAEEDWEDPKETALRRAQEAVAGLSKSDVAELRSFAKPPPAVTMVTSALMIMLTGEQLPWDAAKRVLANGERFLQMLAEFHPDDLTPAQLRMLRPFVRSTSFHPSVIEPVSRCASKFCGWTLGMLQAHAWRAGMAGEDGEDGEGGGEGGGERSEFLEAMDVTKRADPSMDADAALGQSTTLPPVKSLRGAQGADKSLTFAEKLEDRRKQRQAQAQDDAPTPDLKARARARIEQTQMQQSQSMDSASFMGSTAGGASYMGAGGDTAMQASGTMRTQTKAEAKRTAQAKRNVQTMQMTRLATAAGREDMPAAGGDSNKDASGAFVYTCEDGQTKMPYVVLGKPDFAVQKVNIVVFHDFFDTMEATQIFFKQLVSQHLGCQVLIMNLPGQAGTSLPDDEDIVLNNEWQADRVAEMLDGLNATGEMLTHTFPFHCLGIGNGANIATALALRHGRKGPLAKSMRGLVLMNGFARVDSQLSAVLHSSVNVFSCFPPTRPDLPVSYFTRFLFSDEYLQKVDKNLALNLYTAVNNPISLEGRVKICKGALMHVDLRRQLQELNIPMVMVQSTENVLVNPTNIDPFLEGRSVSHLWSHQLTGGGLGAKGRAMLHDSINKRDSAFVMWLRAGHEVRQECKKTLIDLLNQLADPSADLEPLPQEIQPEEEEEESAEARTRPRRKKRKKKVGKGKSGGGGMASTGAAPAEQESDYATDPEPEPQPVPQTQQAQQLQQLEETLAATKRQVEDAPSVPLPASITPAAIRQEQEAREPAAAPEQAAAEQAAPMSAADAEAAERERVFRLEEAEREFEDELKAHKQKKRQAEEALRRETEEGAQPEGGGSHGGDPSGAPGPEEAARIEQKIAQMKEMAEQRQQQADVEAEERISKLRTEQEQRRDQWASEDQQRLQDLESQLEIRQDERGADQAVREKAVGGAQAEIIATAGQGGAVGGGAEQAAAEEEEEEAAVSGETEPPMSRVRRPSIGALIPKQMQLANMFEQMEAEEAEMKRLGILKLEEYERVKREMESAHLDRKRAMAAMAEAELLNMQTDMATRIEAGFRGMNGRRRAHARRIQLEREELEWAASLHINNMIRGWLARRRVEAMKAKEARERELAEASLNIQRVFRGHMARVRVDNIKRLLATLLIQRSYRGYKGRVRARAEKKRQDLLKLQTASATKIQASWRMKMGRDEYRRRRIFELASTELERVWRGYLGRRRAARLRAWENAEPGAERLALGLQMIEESKLAFERQQEEIDALHRAQEQAETRVSQIHAGLVDSERELAILERELQEIDQIERDLHELTHEQELMALENAEGASIPAVGDGKTDNRAAGGRGGPGGDPASREEQKRRQAESYALEMAIHLKRAEREKKKKELESEFASVFGEVEAKKAALSQLEIQIADMEATRLRKDREFTRLQRNLMELLEEQKFELDSLREKGIELETATATSAAAATATAHKAKEHEKRSQVSGSFPVLLLCAVCCVLCALCCVLGT
jgi:pimeloyl-ACP methyl ester carboxylesterase